MWVRRPLPALEQHAACSSVCDSELRSLPSAPPVGDHGAPSGGLRSKRGHVGEKALEYTIRQTSSGPRMKKPRYIDAIVGTGRQLVPSQTRPRNLYDRHCHLIDLLRAPPAKSDLQLLQEAHRFLRTPADDDGSWEARLARRYYDKLFKEYVVCDLAGYRQGNVGFRWRTEAEVVQGKGQFHCGHKPCHSKIGLRSYEVDFKYVEAGERRRALVKARLCEDCAYKLHYKRLKAEQRRDKRRLRKAQKKLKKEKKDKVKSECLSATSESDAGGSEQSPQRGRASSSAGDAATADPSTAVALEDDDRRRLEALAWRGPDPEVRTREDDMDDFLRELLV